MDEHYIAFLYERWKFFNYSDCDAKQELIRLGLIECKTTMTPTAIELWNDKKFVEKRLCEQEEYGRQLDVRLKMKKITQERYDLLNDSYISIWERFNKRFIELIVS